MPDASPSADARHRVFFNDTATTEIYTLSLHDALPIYDVFKFYDDAAIMFSAIHHHPMHYVQMVLGINTDASYLTPYYKQMWNWYKPWAAATYHNNRIIIQF